RMPFRRQPWLTRVKHEGSDHRPAYGHEEHQLFPAGSVVSSAQLREAYRLIRRVKDSLGRVSTPILIVHTEDAATVADVRYVQVHIGSQFLEVYIGSGDRMIPHVDVSETTVLKVAEFFNEVARRRALAVAR